MRRFSLIELATAMAVTATLTALAIPHLTDMRDSAKEAEIAPNVSSIQAAEIGYEATNDKFVTMGQMAPESVLRDYARPWIDGTPFDELGWRPEGDVFGSYIVYNASALDFAAIGQADVDLDGLATRCEAARDDFGCGESAPAEWGWKFVDTTGTLPKGGACGVMECAAVSAVSVGNVK